MFLKIIVLTNFKKCYWLSIVFKIFLESYFNLIIVFLLFQKHFLKLLFSWIFFFLKIFNWYSASILMQLCRGVHGSVRFGLDPKNQPNRITVFLSKINRTGPETGSNRIDPVRLNPVFWGKNREKSSLEVGFLPTLEFFFLP